MNDYNLDFLKDDIDLGLLKLKRTGMKRRTLKYINGRNVEEFIYLPLIKDFVVLRFGGFA